MHALSFSLKKKTKDLSLEAELSSVKLHYLDKGKKTNQNTIVFLK